MTVYLFDDIFRCIGAPELALQLNSLAAGVFFLFFSDALFAKVTVSVNS